MPLFRLVALLTLVALAACGRQQPFDPFPAAHPVAVKAPVAVPPKPAWVARRVVPDAVELNPGNVTVGAGETLAQIAERTRIPLGALLAANGLPSPLVFAGQPLKVPGGRVHTVHAGESGISIARAYGVEWSRVIAMNRLRAPYTLEIGDRLLLPSVQVIAAMSIEQRAAAFKIDIDDLITGAEPAVAGRLVSGRPVSARPPRTASTSAPSTPVPALKPLPAFTGPAPRFEWPLTGRIVSTFGAKPGGRFNDGVNLSADVGDPVRAAADGVVAYAGDAVAGFGNLVLIKHADGWVSAYGHNSAVLVTRGKRVQRGDIIARAGGTGAVTEPQLHFELRRGRTAVDPVKVLPARG
ncbi:peptidoglycan DD-metalloendopeptidase family protein [Glacieibacterium sp.]|uniref:peptidoglycan DD-metalloendopeptidase family protein n=1 Tax=Glacieibacterium sp. TaxID=2860237 RepID=UPI003AFFC5CC